MPDFHTCAASFSPDGSIIPADLEKSDDLLRSLPETPAVFVVEAGSGRPYLARTGRLRRRAVRLLGSSGTPSRAVSLRSRFTCFAYWLSGCSLDSAMTQYEIGRALFPDDYARLLRLRLPPYIRVSLANAWPRSMVTTQPAIGESLSYGPFRSRASAERFEAEYLDLYQIRRCQEDLQPSAEHPGCLYGEVGKCLRPCQGAVSTEEYRAEVSRAADFLNTNGQCLIRSIAAARDSLSAEMDFEEAARQHKKLERVESLVRSRDELARNTAHLQAVVAARSALPGAVDLFTIRDGEWQGRSRIRFELQDGKPISLDRKIRELWSTLAAVRLPARERQERLAIFARWFYSTWRDGEVLVFDRFEDPPIRKLVNAIGRIPQKSGGPA